MQTTLISHFVTIDLPRALARASTISALRTILAQIDETAARLDPNSSDSQRLAQTRLIILARLDVEVGG